MGVNLEPTYTHLRAYQMKKQTISVVFTKAVKLATNSFNCKTVNKCKITGESHNFNDYQNFHTVDLTFKQRAYNNNAINSNKTDFVACFVIAVRWDFVDFQGKRYSKDRTNKPNHVHHTILHCYCLFGTLSLSHFSLM